MPKTFFQTSDIGSSSPDRLSSVAASLIRTSFETNLGVFCPRFFPVFALEKRGFTWEIAVLRGKMMVLPWKMLFYLRKLWFYLRKLPFYLGNLWFYPGKLWLPGKFVVLPGKIAVLPGRNYGFDLEKCVVFPCCS